MLAVSGRLDKAFGQRIARLLMRVSSFDLGRLPLLY